MGCHFAAVHRKIEPRPGIFLGPQATVLLGLDLAPAERWLAKASLCALVIVPGAPVCVVAALANVLAHDAQAPARHHIADVPHTF